MQKQIHKTILRKKILLTPSAQPFLGKEELLISDAIVRGQTLASYLDSLYAQNLPSQERVPAHLREPLRRGDKSEGAQETRQARENEENDAKESEHDNKDEESAAARSRIERTEYLPKHASASESTVFHKEQEGVAEDILRAAPALADLHVLFSYAKNSSKRTVQDFVLLFNSRFKHLEKILQARQELSNVISIGKIMQKKEKDKVAFIGMVVEKNVTKNNNLIFKLEDPTGIISAVVTTKNPEAFKMAQDICLDEIIGITGSSDKIVFIQSIFLPDVPLTKELKKGPVEEYVAFIGDPHFGSKVFLEKEFSKMLLWLNGNSGNDEQRRIASKVKYMIFIGDLVEGVGVYPNQEKDLAMADIYDQYAFFKQYLLQIPKHIRVVLIPGNHDVGRLSEPQPSLFFDNMKDIAELPNVLSLSNPALFTIGAHPDVGFPGFDVLLYHGGSIPYYAENVASIRSQGGLRKTDLVMKYLLQRRHLAPTHASTIYVPDVHRDPLLIDVVPDFFVTGHIHKMTVSSYRNVTLINASCWVGITEYQERRGIIPEPGRLPIVNLQTREVKILNFLSKEDQEKEAQRATGTGGAA